jgi:hypothetical protein
MTLRNLVALTLWLTPCAVAAQAAAPAGPAAVLAEFDRMAARDLWPGFAPRETPLAFWDGTRTLLVRHPAPPGAGWASIGIPGVVARDGRLPQLTANSSDTIGGVMTGTVMPAPPGRSATSQAALAMHELFHVFQRTHHTRWSANEADAFTYPATDEGLLAARRREYALLRKALLTRDRGDAACHAAVALSERAQRFARMKPEHAAYERLSEMNEGLATYVQWRAAGARDEVAVPDSLPMPDAVRAHAYHAGPAWGRLLDRFAPTWRASLEREDTLSLDALLRRAVGAVETERWQCGLTNAERTAIDEGATRDVAQLAATLRRAREGFERAPGRRLEVDGAASTLFPMGFDPLNLLQTAPGEILHRRYIKLGNARGAVEVLDRESMSAAAGAHPLFNGVRRMVITGLGPEFSARAAGDTVVLEGRGVSGRFAPARLTVAGDTVRVVLP